MNKIVLVLIAVVLLGIAGFAAIWFRTGSELQDLATDVLVQCRDGKRRATYEDAQSGFRDRWTFAEFDAYLDYWDTRLGAFAGVENLRDVTSRTLDGRTSREVTLDLRYERGPAEGFFEFEEDERGTYLVHLSLHPSQEDTEPRDRAALVVPSEALLRTFEAGESMAVYAALAPDAQRSVGCTALVNELTFFRDALGKLEQIRVKGTTGAADDMIVYAFDLQGEHARGQASVGWFRPHKRWDVSTFKLTLQP